MRRRWAGLDLKATAPTSTSLSGAPERTGRRPPWPVDVSVFPRAAARAYAGRRVHKHQAVTVSGTRTWLLQRHGAEATWPVYRPAKAIINLLRTHRVFGLADFIRDTMPPHPHAPSAIRSASSFKLIFPAARARA
jgi:hypothetical protein